ncbi:MAG: lipocalin family protein [Chitinispirillia bacterium]|nr:lipocalin family protein [Chitinispirillia bacterium]MCL2269533.1 lipocalin family protein [Chitinispirillia bacterium]
MTIHIHGAKRPATRARLFFGMLAAVIFAIIQAGCGGPVYYDEEGRGHRQPPNNPNQSAAHPLVLTAGYAWIDTFPPGDREGYVFRADKTVLFLSDHTGPWTMNNGGTWSTNGNRLTMNPSPYPSPTIYEISGDTLRINNTHVLIKTMGVTFQ